jgi:hypothetical protein
VGTSYSNWQAGQVQPFDIDVVVPAGDVGCPRDVLELFERRCGVHREPANTGGNRGRQVAITLARPGVEDGVSAEARMEAATSSPGELTSARQPSCAN